MTERLFLYKVFIFDDPDYVVYSFDEHLWEIEHPVVETDYYRQEYVGEITTKLEN